MTQRLLTAVEVADLLAVPKTRVWSMSRRGEIPTVRLGATGGSVPLGGHRCLDRATDNLAAAGYAVLRTGGGRGGS